MSKINTGFIIKDIKVIDETSVAVIKFDVFYASHRWARSIRINLDDENLKNFTYEDLRKRVRSEATYLIRRRAPIENNINRLKKMIGQERSF